MIFKSRIANFFRQGVIYPENLILEFFGGTLPVRALQAWPLGLQRI